MSGLKQRLAALVVGVLVTSSLGVIATAGSAAAAVTPKTGAAGALAIVAGAGDAVGEPHRRVVPDDHGRNAERRRRQQPG